MIENLLKVEMLFFVVLSMVVRLAVGGGGVTDLVHSKWDFIHLGNVPLFNFVYFSFLCLNLVQLVAILGSWKPVHMLDLFSLFFKFQTIF